MYFFYPYLLAIPPLPHINAEFQVFNLTLYFNIDSKGGEGVCIIIADSRHFFVCHVIMGNPGIMFKNWRKREFNKDKVGMDGVMARHPGGQLQKFIIFFWKSPMYSSLEKTSSRHSSFPNSLIFSALELNFGFLLVSYFQL